ALGDYFRRVEKPEKEVSATLAWNGKSEQVTVNEEQPFKMLDFALSKDAAAKPLRLANPDKKKVFAEILIESHPQTIAQPRQDQGYSIRRTYAKVGDDNTLSDLKEPHVGDRVLVTLNVDVNRFAHYVVVDDPLPANFEAINPVFKSQETRAGERLGQPWEIDYQELRDDRALFFADSIPPGQYTIRYLARVRTAGTATAPASKVEEMYHPERFGMTETMQVTSLPLK
ncbi:MAG: hypothetical protein P4L00_06315, partial [Candidatus Acidoferrales bacterium]|nr:hypothetical protein [Candidatus Acidoferrales bacterium]